MKPNVTIVYLTTSGNTRKAARRIAEAMRPWANVTITALRDAERNPTLIESADIVGLGGPVFHLRSAERLARFIKACLPANRASKKQAFLFCTYAGITSGLALLSPARALYRKGYLLLGALKLKAPHFYQRDVTFPDEEALRIIELFAVELEERTRQAPSSRALLKKLDYQGMKVKILHRIIPVFSRLRVPRITLDTTLCTQCGVCSRTCPAAAMSVADGFPILARRTCMHCYHCVESCRQHALSFDEGRLREIVQLNKRVLGMEEPATAIM